MPAQRTIVIEMGGWDGAQADIIINGTTVIADQYQPVASYTNPAPYTFYYTGTVDSNIDTITVDFNNDNGPRRIYVESVTIDGQSVDIGETRQLFSNGQTTDELINVPTAIGHLDYEGYGIDHNWGGVNFEQYRDLGGEYQGRDRTIDDEGSNTVVFNIEADGIDEVEEIVAILEDTQYASNHVVIHLEEGVHTFTERLTVRRDNVTFEGAGREDTTIVADFSGTANNLIEFIGPDITQNYTGSPNVGRWNDTLSRQVDSNAKTADSWAFGDKTITLNSVDDLAVGEHIMFYAPDNTAGQPSLTSMAEIAGISGNTVTLKHGMAFASAHAEGVVGVYEVDLLDKITVRDFSITYALDLENDVDWDPNNDPEDPTLEALDDIVSHNYVPKYAITGGIRDEGDLTYSHHRALVVAGTHEANIENIGFKDIGSSGLYLSGSMEAFVNNILVDGTLNRGIGGNGYGVELESTFYSDLHNIEVFDARHAISYNYARSSGFNNIHSKDLDTNIDFHGGRDQGNIYYTGHMKIDPFFQTLSEAIPNSTQTYRTPTVATAEGHVQENIIDYRDSAHNADENLVIWDYVISHGSANAQDSSYKSNWNLSTQNDFLEASENGAVVYGGFGNDTLVGGEGGDTFVYDTHSKTDIIKQFNTSEDVIWIEENINNTIFTTETAVRNAATTDMVTGWVILNLGNDSQNIANKVTLEGVTNINAVEIEFFTTTLPEYNG